MKDDFALLVDWTSQLGVLEKKIISLKEIYPVIFKTRIGDEMLKELNETIEFSRKMKKKYDLPEYNEKGKQ